MYIYIIHALVFWHFRRAEHADYSLNSRPYGPLQTCGILSIAAFLARVARRSFGFRALSNLKNVYIYI